MFMAERKVFILKQFSVFHPFQRTFCVNAF